MNTNHFSCKRLNAPITPVSTCLARQRANLETPHRIPFISCVRCSQGEEIYKKHHLTADKMKGEEMKDNAASSTDPKTRLCSECNEKPTMSKNCPYCASCMARRSHIKRPKNTTATEQHLPEPLEVNKGLTVHLDFMSHKELHGRLEDLARDELRSLENQVIYILKSHVKEVTGGNIAR